MDESAFDLEAPILSAAEMLLREDPFAPTRERLLRRDAVAVPLWSEGRDRDGYWHKVENVAPTPTLVESLTQDELGDVTMMNDMDLHSRFRTLEDYISGGPCDCEGREFRWIPGAVWCGWEPSVSAHLIPRYGASAAYTQLCESEDVIYHASRREAALV